MSNNIFNKKIETQLKRNLTLIKNFQKKNAYHERINDNNYNVLFIRAEKLAQQLYGKS